MSWQLLSASVTGASHTRSRLPCQDAHSIRVLDNGWLLCAVVDGLGSAELAERGAQVAVQLALDTLASGAAQKTIIVDSEAKAAITVDCVAGRGATRARAFRRPGLR